MESAHTMTGRWDFGLIKWSRSVMSPSLGPHGLETARLLHHWDFPGKNTEVGRHFLLQGIFPTQESNPVSHTAGRLFTIWATTEVKSFHKSVTFRGCLLQQDNLIHPDQHRPQLIGHHLESNSCHVQDCNQQYLTGRGENKKMNLNFRI